MRGLLLIAAMTILTSCVSRDELLQRDRQTCAEIGFAPASESYMNCLLQLQSARVRGHHARY